MADDTLRIEHHAASEGGRGRFAVVVEGHECELDYQLDRGVMVITHTGVPGAVGGRGIAAQLVQTAFDAARAAGWKVRPACSYAGVWVRRHPQYQSLVAR